MYLKYLVAFTMMRLNIFLGTLSSWRKSVLFKLVVP